ncbi:hypothetical protein GUJ93_ZPchr0010g9486 [Zizania palustris]|uniref:B box-type domain-containing protein n=1 Tax=Zizania palustris TaxID=103762 RepID=A0A8J5W8X9_ZIZPA|nr:hypothetical protein GUJ93_ZPchr0010g9486 [Zizania palustris]
MKVLCSVCEAAEASVLCYADQAALCMCRDSKVHAANRLARKHQRLPLLAPCAVSAAQECHAYFFCLEDRALLCRSCDVAVHMANAFVSAHRRFLLTGVQVGQEQEDPSPDTPEPSSPLPPPPSKGDPAPFCSEGGFSWEAEPMPAMDASSLPDWSVVNEQFCSPPPRHTKTASLTPPKRSPRAPAFGGHGGMMDWPLGEFFGGFSDFNGGGFGFGDTGTSKADSGKLGGSIDGSPYYRSSSEEDRNAEELFGQVPEIQWSVIQWPSPPAASGLHCQRRPVTTHGVGAPESTAFVPDICSPDSSLLRHCFPATSKRRRKF